MGVAGFGQNLRRKCFIKDFFSLFSWEKQAGLGGIAAWEPQLAALASHRTRQPTIIMGLFLSVSRDFLLQVDCNSRCILTALDSFMLWGS